MEQENRRKFCYMPWARLDIYAGHKAQFCCDGWLTTDSVDIGDRSIMEVWNSKEAKELRSSILDGSFRYCRKEVCPYIHDLTPSTDNGYPKRVQYVDQITHPELRKIIDENILEAPFGPRFWNASHDQTCNLSCPSCRKDIIALKKDEADKEIAFQNRVLNEIGSGLKKIDVTGGGDPFASPVYRDLLKQIPHKSPDANIVLFSNGVLWNEKNWNDLGDARKQVRSAIISIDAAMEETYRIVRRGGDWKKLLKNLEFIAKLRKNNDVNYVKLMFVTQKMNYREMPDFVRLCKRYKFDEAHFIMMTNWGTFTDEEFKQHHVSDPSHPEYLSLLEVLKDPIFDDPCVFLGAYQPIRETALKRRFNFIGRIKELLGK